MKSKTTNFMQGVFLGNLLILFSFILIVGLILYSVFTQVADKEFSLMATILGVVTFLFGTFIAFSLADRHQRIDKLRDNDSIERSQLIAIASACEIYGAQFKKKVIKTIDEYLMATLDHDIWDYSQTEPYFQKLFKVILGAPLKNNKSKAFFSDLIGMVNTLGIARTETIGIIDDRLSKFEWTIFISLSAVLIGSMVSINTGSVPSILVVSILSLAVLILLRFLYSLDSLKWKEETRIFEPYEKTFEAVGLMRYYHEDIISEKKVKTLIKPYRVGHFPQPYPNLNGKTIKIVK